MRIRDALPLQTSETFDRFLARVAGADPDILSKSPSYDHGTVSRIALIMLFNWLFQTVVFAAIGYSLFGTSALLSGVVCTLIGAFLATYILLIDSYMVMRSGWHLSGIAELKRGGVDISGGRVAQTKAGLSLTSRLTLAGATSQLSAVLGMVLILHNDIVQRVDLDFKRANAVLIADTTRRIDAGIDDAKRAEASVAAQLAQTRADLRSLRQRLLQLPSDTPGLALARAEFDRLSAEKSAADQELMEAQRFAANEAAGVKANANNSGIAGEGVRYRAAMARAGKDQARSSDLAKAVAAAEARIDDQQRQINAANEAARKQIDEQIATGQTDEVAEARALEDAQHHVAALVRGREVAITAAVSASPDFKKKEDGFLGQIGALKEIAEDDPVRRAVIVVIEVAAFGLEFAGVLAKLLGFVPTTYALMLASNAYLTAVRMAQEILSELYTGDPDDPFDFDPPDPGNDNRRPREPGNGAEGPESPFEPTSPKRKRGRPRKETAH